MEVDPEQLKQLFEEGKGRNEIARILGVSTRQVDNAAKAAGLRFNRARTHVATVARSRALSAELIALAELAAGVAWVSWTEGQQAGLTARDRRELSVAGAAAYDKTVHALSKLLGDEFDPDVIAAGAKLGRLRAPMGSREPPEETTTNTNT